MAVPPTLPPSAPGSADRERRRRQGLVMLGLFLTFLGVGLVSLVLPVGASAIERDTPWAAAGLAALWLGGILMGSAAARRPRVVR